MLGVTALMTAVVFSAVGSERRFELGVLRAVGMSPARLVALLTLEAALATGLGGLLGLLGGALLVRLAQHTVVSQLALRWPSELSLAGLALGTLALAALVGALGALLPAWRLGRQEPYDLLRGEP